MAETTGWFEFVSATAATTHIAYVYEDGSVYLPEGRDVVDQDDFTYAAARGKVFRLVRADEYAGWRPPAHKITDRAELETLPLGSIVIEEVPPEPEDWRTDPCPNVLVRIAIDGKPVWLYRGETEPYRTNELVLPVMVVWQPEVNR